MRLRHAKKSANPPSGSLFAPERLRRYFQAFFMIAAVWNFAGGLPGAMFPALMFEREFGRVLEDPSLVAIYRGAWGTSVLYGIGWLIVAQAPAHHWGIVAMGGLGKMLFALNLAYMYLNGWTSDFALVVIAGDFFFVLGFIAYFFWLRRSASPLFGKPN
jgi:hypothetical protein